MINVLNNDLLAKSSQIVDVKCFPLHLPMLKPLNTASHGITFGSSMYVRIRTQGGVEGWGESGADVVMAGETLKGMMAMVEQHLNPRLLGKSVFDRVSINKSLRLVYGNGGAKAAVDIALLDLTGKILGIRAVDVLGGAARKSTSVLRLIGGSSNVQADVDEALAIYSQGFKAFKLKVGVASIEQEALTVKELRAALGPGVSIAADANMAWDVASSLRFVEMTAPYGLAFLEQPVSAGDVGRMAAVTGKSSVPIGADESIHGIGDMLSLLREKAINGLSLKSVKFGGPTPLQVVGTVADVMGLSVNVAMLVESKLASAAMIHAACALPQVDWGLSLGSLWLSDDPIATDFEISDGVVECPNGPGLGVTVDEKELRRFAAK